MSVVNVYKVDRSMLRPEMEFAFYLPVPGCQALQMSDTRGGQAGVMGTDITKIHPNEEVKGID
ncbi:hypothetical protein [Paenibacillus polymyxa]|uniref:hypothetical protein n=1 Tax=Paenibacillus polymyxa TaxID=1406 RepID=UPI001FD5FF83|nr:hypothetical protein [Paenibacillus polymyxa]URJ34662.1 hypothetical protein MF625_003960 [Paenibacillus polymyxa]